MENVFQPVRGSEDSITRQPKHEGYVYFAYDTGNIYLDKDGTRYLMGGSSSGIYYTDCSKDNLKKVDEMDDTNLEYYIPIESLLDTSALPLKNSLIINSDGKFFKVLSSNMTTRQITGELLAVSGTGGGGEGQGSTTQSTVSLEFDSKTIQSGSVYLYKAKSVISMIPHITGNNKDSAVDIEITYEDRNNPDTKAGRVFVNNHPINTRYDFDTSLLPESDNILITFRVNSLNSGMLNGKLYRYSIGTVDMSIEKVISKNTMVIKPNDQHNLVLNFIAHGASKLRETLHMYIDDVEVAVSEDRKLIDSKWDGQSIDVTVPRQSHGSHTIDLALSAKINGMDVYTNKIRYEGAWATEGETTPIVWLGEYDKEIVNYEPSYVNFMVYDPIAVASDTATNVQIYHESQLISEMVVSYSENTWATFDITSIYNLNKNSFSIICRGAKKDFDIFVTSVGARDLSLRATESLLLNYSSSGKSSTEIASSRARWINKGTSGDLSKAALLNFNWNNNGWMRDASPLADGVDVGTYLSVANGAAVEINCPAYTLNGNMDYTIETRFRVKNIQQYSTLIQTIPKYFYITKDGIKSTDSKTEAEIISEGLEIARNKNGYLDTDDAHFIRHIETEKGVICKWLNAQGQGLCIGTQEAYFQNPNGIISVRYKEDEVINLSVVISRSDHVIYIYLNGILSGACDMPATAGTFTISNPFIFDSEYCDLDLFRFRIYQTALTMPQVIHNYLSDLHSIKLFDQNQLTESITPTELSFDKLMDYNKKHPTELSMPYAIWEITDTKDSTERLPFFKGNVRLATVEFVNPVANYQLDLYEKTKGEQGISPFEYYSKSPSFKAQNVEINVQGTSSQGYPRRNYKTKFKTAEEKWVYTHGPLKGQPLTKSYTVLDKDGKEQKLSKKFHMDNQYIGTNKFTWKIDYMESSGTYNTGFANLMGNLEHPLYNKHPLDDLGIDASGMRTSVYGFPVLVFHKYANAQNNPTNSKSEYEYIGRYNMNLDKGSNEYYGFEVEKEQPYLPKQTYVEKKKQEDGSETEVSTERRPFISEIAECWELSDNQGTWCSFRFPSDEARAAGFNARQDGKPDRLEVMQHFEYRYSPYDDQLDAIGADGKYDGTTDKPKIIAEIGSTDATKSAYAYDKYKNLEVLFKWLDATDTSSVTNATLESPVTYMTDSDLSNVENGTVSVANLDSAGKTVNYTTTFSQDTREYRLAKFRTEFDKHLDKEYCLVYFIMTELLLCYDSRGKNMMMASFGPHEVDGDYIWYPIFYDIDTQLGINNSGAPLWDYDADVSTDNIFSTPNSVLWNNFFEVFAQEIKDKYSIMRGSSNASGRSAGQLSYETITGAYECNPTIFKSYAMDGVRPIIAIGLDEYYKYIAPLKGYFDTEGKVVTEGNITSALQGDKKFTTKLLLLNRLNYIDSWWQSGAYTITRAKQGNCRVRGNANSPSDTSDKYLDNVNLPAGFEYAQYPKSYFDARPGYKLKPFLKQYVFYYIDETASTSTSSLIKYNASPEQADGIWLSVPESVLTSYKSSSTVPQQINYIPGVDYLSSLGDLSLAYLDEFKLDAGKRLLDLRIGSDIPGYVNSKFSNGQIDFNDKADSASKKPLLKQVILTNLPMYSTAIDFEGSPKMQEVRALNTQIPQIYIAPGAPIHTFHLPKSIQKVELVQAKELTRILTEVPVVATLDESGVAHYADPETYRGLYIEGVTDFKASDENAGCKLNTLILEGGSLNYDSYILLDNLFKLKHNAENDRNLVISLKDVNWTPYTQIESGEAYDSDIQYYYLTDHSSYIPYSYTNIEQWNSDALNGLVYTYTNKFADKQITSLSMLDTFIKQYEAGNYQFYNPTGTTTIPAITGNLYVDNDEAHPISEEELTAKYKKYFPSLNITAKHIAEANITKYVRVLDTGKTEVIEVIRSNEPTAQIPTEQVPTKANNDFQGWATDKDGNNMILHYDIATGKYNANDLESLKAFSFTSDSDKLLTFYAIFKLHKYSVAFYLDMDSSPFEVKYITYGDKYEEPNAIPEKDDPSLPLESAYLFNGYSLTSTDTTEVTSSPPEKVTRDLKLYATFKLIEDIHTSEPVQKYFSVIDGTIFPRENVILPKKVLIPSKDSNGNDITAIGNFQKQSNLSHLFLQKNNSIKTITASAFDNNRNLKYFDFANMNNLKAIESYAFRLTSLQSIELPEGLISIGDDCFNQCNCNNASSTPIVVKIPSTVTTIKHLAFSYMVLPKNSVFEIGSNALPSAFDATNTSTSASNPTEYLIFDQNKESAPYTIKIWSHKYTGQSNQINETYAFRALCLNADKDTDSSWDGLCQIVFGF